MGQENSRDKLEIISRQTTWANKVLENRLEMVSKQVGQKDPKIKKIVLTTNLGQESPKDRLAKKATRIE